MIVEVCVLRNNYTKVTQSEIEPETFRLPGQCPNHLAMLPHTCIHTHINTYTW